MQKDYSSMIVYTVRLSKNDSIDSKIKKLYAEWLNAVKPLKKDNF